MKLHEALLELKRAVESGQLGVGQHVVSRNGICTLVAALMDYNAMTLPRLRLIYMGWPEYTGQPGWPIPSTTEETPIEAFSKNRAKFAMWTGDYGAARMRLLDHLIESTK